MSIISNIGVAAAGVHLINNKNSNSKKLSTHSILTYHYNTILLLIDHEFLYCNKNY